MSKFQRERAHDVWEEMLPLFDLHWEEIAHFKDIPLEPDFEKYMRMEDAGCLRVYTARRDDDVLIGYAVFFLQHNLHYKSSLQASQDVIFIDPQERGTGTKLILWCDAQLKKEGVKVVYQHIKVATPKTVDLFKRMGYSPVDLIMAKRLDKDKGEN